MSQERVTITIDGHILQQIDALIDKKNIRSRSHAFDHLIRIALHGSQTTQAVIFIGGEKAPANQKHTLDFIAQMKNYGVTDIIIILGFYARLAQNVIGSGEKLGVPISYHVTELGSGGGLKEIQSQLHQQFFIALIDQLESYNLARIQGYFDQFNPNLAFMPSQKHPGRGVGILGEQAVQSLPEGFSLLEEELFKTLLSQNSLVIVPNTPLQA